MAGGPTAQIKKALRGVGFELQRFDPDGSFAKRRQRLLASERVDLVIDVGAHAGEYAGSLRHGGYGSRILSFEPQAQMFDRLREASSADPLWDCRNHAVGASRGSTTLHVSGNEGFSSSIRPMAAIHEEAEPESSYVDSESVSVVTLDEAIAEMPEGSDRLMLKVDTQGYESEVLAGAPATLRRCHLVELELVLVELYEGQALFAELVDQMADHGFLLTDIESGFRDPRTSQLLQVDGLFIRRDG
ncbi:MAG TPA: FkbM family methyltransferase [Solirubrobacterales bacterium]